MSQAWLTLQMICRITPNHLPKDKQAFFLFTIDTTFFGVSNVYEMRLRMIFNINEAINVTAEIKKYCFYICWLYLLESKK